MEFLGYESDPRQSCDQSHSSGKARSLTHWARLGIQVLNLDPRLHKTKTPIPLPAQKELPVFNFFKRLQNSYRGRFPSPW